MTHTIPEFPNRADYDNPNDYDTAIERVLAADDWHNTAGQAIAREVFHLITTPQPAADSGDLRPARKCLGLSLTEVADALDCAISKISLIERGTIRDTRFLHCYRAWLNENQPHQIAA